jgi:hypothetical protein
VALCEKTGEKSGGLDASQRVISDGWEAQPQSHGTPRHHDAKQHGTKPKQSKRNNFSTSE